MTDTFYTPEEVADYLKLSIQTIRSWINSGKIKAARFGRQYRITGAELERIKQAAFNEAAAEVKAQ